MMFKMQVYDLLLLLVLLVCWNFLIMLIQNTHHYVSCAVHIVFSPDYCGIYEALPKFPNNSFPVYVFTPSWSLWSLCLNVVPTILFTSWSNCDFSFWASSTT